MIIRGSNLSIFFRINLISPRSFDFEYSFIYLKISNKKTKFLIGGEIRASLDVEIFAF